LVSYRGNGEVFSKGRDFAAMGADTGFHADQAWGHLRPKVDTVC
jgi:hypothetical protein